MSIRKFYFLVSTLIIIAFWINCVYAQSKKEARPSAMDIASMSSVSDIRISPNGQTIVYSLLTNEFDSSAAFCDDDTTGGWMTYKRLWTADVETNQLLQLTWKKRDFSPVWSHDSRYLAFIRESEDSSHICIMPTYGGEPRPLDVGELQPNNPQWSPSDSTIAFTAEVPLTDAEKETIWRTGGIEIFNEEWRSSQIWTVDRDGGKVQQITRGNEHINEYVWSPKGNQFCAMMTASSDPYVTFHQATPAVISLDGVKIDKLESKPVNANTIRWSPDGRYIAYLYAKRGLSIMNTVRVHDLQSHSTFDLVTNNDWTIQTYEWYPDSRSLLIHIIDKMVSGLFRVSLDGNIIQEYDIQNRVIEWQDLSIDNNGNNLTCPSSTGAEPVSIGVLDLVNNKYRKLVDINPQVKNWSTISTEVVTWTNREGVELDGILYKTPFAKVDSPPALMVYPHGGPDGVSMDYYSGWVHFFTARGYSVFRPNYRGGIGYGFEFYAANRGRLGEIEWLDIESGVDQLISDKKADPDRLIYGGWSWGGYLTAWAIGHTDRYKAAVVGAGVTDVRNQYVTSDINHGIVGNWEYKGNPWEQAENFERANPVRYLSDAKTPTLIVHGKGDDRVHFVQGITLYRALKDVGCDVTFLAFPREPHGFREPAHIIGLLNGWSEWYEKYIPGQ